MALAILASVLVVSASIVLILVAIRVEDLERLVGIGAAFQLLLASLGLFIAALGLLIAALRYLAGTRDERKK